MFQTPPAFVSGILFNDGASWRAHRRFTLKTLKEMGFGKNTLETTLIEEADRIGDFFLEKNGRPFVVQSLFSVVILNVLWTIVANRRYRVANRKRSLSQQ